MISLPVYPYELALENKTGDARIAAFIDQTGAIKEVKVLEASHPDFGESAKAMLRNWKIRPALKDGKPIAIQFNHKHEFNWRARDNSISEETDVAIRNIKSYPERIVDFDKLDARPKLLYQPQPVDPRTVSVADAPPDKIQIEFIIDREGSVQLPRIISATNTDLAWSIMTAMNRWLFEVPKAKGEAVFARRQMMFEYH